MNLEKVDQARSEEIRSSVARTHERQPMISEVMLWEYNRLKGHAVRCNLRGLWIEPQFEVGMIEKVVACEIFPNQDQIHIADHPKLLHEDLRKIHMIPDDQPRISGDVLFIRVDQELLGQFIRIDTTDTPPRTTVSTQEMVKKVKEAGYIVYGPHFELL